MDTVGLSLFPSVSVCGWRPPAVTSTIHPHRPFPPPSPRSAGLPSVRVSPTTTPTPGATATQELGGESKPAADERAAVAADQPGAAASAPPPPPPPLSRPATPPRQARRKTVKGKGDRVSVYVYDGVPELDFSGLIGCHRDGNHGVPPWQDERSDVAQDMGEIWLHRCVHRCAWGQTSSHTVLKNTREI